MNIHCFQHVPFEGLAAIEDWINERNHKITFTKFFNNGPLPSLNNFDLLIVMGGPMSFDDYDDCSWLKGEIEFIKKVINEGKAALGICLGAQLLAQAIDGSAKHGQCKEIGWFPVTFENTKDINGLEFLPKEFMTFHWHGDTFNTPKGAVKLASSEATPNQAFIYNEKVIGLQFHFEMDHNGLDKLIKKFRKELNQGTWVMSEDELFKGTVNFEANHKMLWKLMDYLENIVNK